MRYILTAEQMKAADGRMIHEVGIPSLVLMERAALQCVAGMKEEHVDLSYALVVCGSGNNGGDGFAVARLLAGEGHRVDVCFVGKPESRSEETKQQMQILENLGVSIGNTLPEREYSVIIDAVFGIGLCRNIEGHYRDVIEQMNRYLGYKVAIDTPSGISADTGEVLGCAFRADLTVTFAYGKAGQIFYPGCEYAGKVLVKDIGITDPGFDGREDIYFTLERRDVLSRMPERKPDSNKGSYGRILLIAGSRGMSGAAYLSAHAAYMVGAGLVRIYTEESNRQILQQLLPEAVITTYDEMSFECFRELPDLLQWADVVCIGCGLGMSEYSRKLLKMTLELNRKPCVIDADGLNLLAEFTNEEKRKWARRKDQYVLTPHMKEMSRLTGCTVAELKNQRTGLLRSFAENMQVVCAMKDSRTLVAASGHPTFLNTSGNAAMAKAGSGDVLAGTIAGIMAQNVSPYDAAVLGVYLHGLAGDTAREECGSYSVLAEDLIRALGRTLKTLEEN
ncbi:MAG: NAD(P)H-hydrate dehydratase [Bariatricus sp.]